jgi:hypothetical protein
VTARCHDKPENVAAAEALGMTGHVHTASARTIARIAGFAAG